jgi:hypothetical protein
MNRAPRRRARAGVQAQENDVSNSTIDPVERPLGGAEPRAETRHLGETSRGKRKRAERLLARYPGLAPHELEELLRWYRREASAMDSALIASNPAVHDRYRAFRRDHIDRFSWNERVIGTVLAIGAQGFLGAVALLGLEA